MHEFYMSDFSHSANLFTGLRKNHNVTPNPQLRAMIISPRS